MNRITRLRERLTELKLGSATPGAPIAIRLRAPIVVMILAATAVPIEWRSSVYATVTYSNDVGDFLANIAGYVPVGIVFATLGWTRGVLAATALATFAEVAQLWMMHRDPSPPDVIANVMGGVVGVAIARRWRIEVPAIDANSWRAVVACVAACALALAVWTNSGHPLSVRGAMSPGTLEAYWPLDDNDDGVARDVSGHHLDGRFNGAPRRVSGVRGGGALFDGSADYIDAGNLAEFRLQGSLTISAWIKSSRHPIDDAAIVSSLSPNEAGGFQLDTTIDRGPRTIGFKLANACRTLMARYGATPLRLDTWYHVAAVYDNQARTLDVYLNGRLDNGFLLGTVTSLQRASRDNIYIGKRTDSVRFNFAGTIDDVRVYSRALNAQEIREVMDGTVAGITDGAPSTRESERQAGVQRGLDVPPACSGTSERADGRLPGAVGVLGVLVAFACIGLFPRAGLVLPLVVSALAGWLLLQASASTLPPMNALGFPLTSLAAGASVVASITRRGTEVDQ